MYKTEEEAGRSLDKYTAHQDRLKSNFQMKQDRTKVKPPDKIKIMLILKNLLVGKKRLRAARLLHMLNVRRAHMVMLPNKRAGKITTGWLAFHYDKLHACINHQMLKKVKPYEKLIKHAFERGNLVNCKKY